MNGKKTGREMNRVMLWQDVKGQAAVWGVLAILLLFLLAAGLVDVYRLVATRTWAYTVAQEAALTGVSKSRTWDMYMTNGLIALDEVYASENAQQIIQDSMQFRGVKDYHYEIQVLPLPDGGSVPGFPPVPVRLGESLGDWSSEEASVGVYLTVPVDWVLLDLFGIPAKGVQVFAAAGVAQ
jgi:hypothetical protein